MISEINLTKMSEDVSEIDNISGKSIYTEASIGYVEQAFLSDKHHDTYSISS